MPRSLGEGAGLYPCWRRRVLRFILRFFESGALNMREQTLGCVSERAWRKVSLRLCNLALLTEGSVAKNRFRRRKSRASPLSIALPASAMDDSEAYYRAHAQAFQLPLLGLLLAVGVPANATLLLLFARHAELRTACNALILNIAVIDLLNLLLNVPVFLLDVVLVRAGTLSAPLAPCKPAAYLMGCSTGLSVFSVAALSVFRLRSVTTPGLGSAALVAALHVAAVWVLGLACAVPLALSWGMTAGGKCSYVSGIELVTYWNFAVFCATPILVIAGTYTATAVRLARSARDMPGEPLGQGAHRRARRRSARVLVALTLVYALSNGPYFVNGVLVYLDVWADYGMQAWVALDLYCLSFANAMVNPLALCCTCASFRRLFRRYWTPCIFRNAPRSPLSTANTASVFQISRHVT